MRANSDELRQHQRIVRTSCDHCYFACGVLAYSENGRITKLRGDPDHPLNQGKLCAKGAAHLSQMYSAERLLYPLKRKGTDFYRVSWKDALEEIAERLNEIKIKHNALAISGASNGGGRQVLNTLLLRALGSPNVYVNHSICSGSLRLGDVATYGEWITGDPQPDFANSRCIMVVGSNPEHTAPPWWIRIRKALKDGAKLITIDPRFTGTAARSDLWLSPKPGTDTALGLGMANVIIQENLYDADFVTKWGYGFDKFAQGIKEYDVAQVASITGVPVDSILKAAHMFATIKPGCMHIRSGLNGNPCSTQAVRAMNILLALTGNLDIPGGNRFKESRMAKTGIIPPDVIHARRDFRLPPEIEARTIGAEQFPLCSGPNSVFAAVSGSMLFDAMLTGTPYPVRSMLIAGSNPVINHPAACKVREALKSLDLLVVSELYMTPTAQLAHFVLPVSDYLERDGVCQYSGECLSVRQKVVEPPGECKDDSEIALQLAKILRSKGFLRYPDLIPWDSVYEFIDFQIMKFGITFEELKLRGVIKFEPEFKQYERSGRFRTATGKVEFWSTLLEKHGFDPLPRYEEIRLWHTDTSREFPLTLIAGVRHWAYKHSMNRTSPWLKKVLPDPLVEINPITATSLGLKEGDWAEIYTPYGGPVRQKVVCAPKLDSSYVVTLDGWWYPNREEGGWSDSNVNVLTTNTQDPISGAYWLKGIPCRLINARSSMLNKSK